ncbi:transposable element Tc3 transposase [Trichonephila clavipes]|nr:transposable element Tc3 transposase [Trichonephila clavipes]
MGWPAFSLELSRVENVGYMLERRVVAHQPPPTILSELWRALLDAWRNILQDQINNLILSMPRIFTDCMASSVKQA